MTDGESNQGLDPVGTAASAKAKGTEIFCIGIGSGADFYTLNMIATAPADTHVFNVQSFDKLQEILDAIVAKSCIEVASLQPSSGPASGGTQVIVTGNGFQNSPTLSCKFGNVVVKATFGDAQHILCMTYVSISHEI
jgi:hypothetical protein